jgi:UDP-2,4-diacetamido-2,4,6-trideoxy-beta-L-altropyranose hydrolase
VASLHDVIFRVDASAATGGGHLMRCFSLAEALAARGARCRFFVGPEAEAVLGSLQERPDEVVVAQDPDAAAVDVRAGLIVVDHYGYTAEMERRLRDRGAILAVIDERLDRRHDADLIIDQTPGRSVDAIRPFVPAGCEILVGIQYALLRSQFAAARSLGPIRPISDESGPRTIFVSMGLTDPTDATSLVLRSLVPLRERIRVTVTLGSGAPHLSAVRTFVSANSWVSLHVDPPRIWELMAAADLAVGGAGGSAWERCCLGLPSVVLTLADNQSANAAALQRAGATVLGSVDAVDEAGLRTAVATLLDHPQNRARMGQAAAALVDGRGSGRAAERLLARAETMRRLRA